MQTATMEFNELEWCSYAVQASAGKVICNVATHSKLAFQHYAVLMDLSSVNECMLNLLKCLHSPATIKALEASTPEELDHLSAEFQDTHNRLRVVVLKIRSFNLGFWKRLYFSRLDKLEAYNRELFSHIEAFKATDSSLILLSKRDQEFLLESLLAPPKANDALHHAFRRQ